MFLRPASLLKKIFWRSCFPVNFVKFLRTPLVAASYHQNLKHQNEIFKAKRSLFWFILIYLSCSIWRQFLLCLQKYNVVKDIVCIQKTKKRSKGEVPKFNLNRRIITAKIDPIHMMKFTRKMVWFAYQLHGDSLGISEACFYQPSTRERFHKIVDDNKLLTIFAKTIFVSIWYVLHTALNLLLFSGFSERIQTPVTIAFDCSENLLESISSNAYLEPRQTLAMIHLWK